MEIKTYNDFLKELREDNGVVVYFEVFDYVKQSWKDADITKLKEDEWFISSIDIYDSGLEMRVRLAYKNEINYEKPTLLKRLKVIKATKKVYLKGKKGE